MLEEVEPCTDAKPASGGARRPAPPEAVIDVELEADLEAVWRALTTDAGLADWLGAGSTIGQAPGDALWVNDIVTGEHKRGVLDEVTPQRRLGYTWWPETAPDQATRVAISLEPLPGGTRVTVVESRPFAAPAVASVARAQAATDQLVAPMAGEWAWRTAVLRLVVEMGALVDLSS